MVFNYNVRMQKEKLEDVLKLEVKVNELEQMHKELRQECDKKMKRGRERKSGGRTRSRKGSNSS